MGKGPDRKIQKAKARQEAIRKQKAQVAAQPRLLREHPGLGAALSIRHPLVGYFVNEGWEKARMAGVVVVREAETGQVFASFLVDTMWRGLKDCFGNYALADALDELESYQRPGQPGYVPLDPTLAVTLIRGGIAWAQRFHYPLPANYEMWLRLVDPAPAEGLDLRLFGENGLRPQILGTPEEVMKYERGRIDNLQLVAVPPAALDAGDDDEVDDEGEEAGADEGADDPALADDDPPPDKPGGLLRFLRR